METSHHKQKLRFAALCRVSTEKQEKKGESLRTQRRDLLIAVEQLGGKIISWYGGQEHAVEGYEKKELDRLLRDAQKGNFNAFIVTDADRWSRDNSKSKEGLEIFKTYDIRFFIETSEMDLFNPAHLLTLGMHAEIGAFFALTTKRKSLKNRIERAKRGHPTCGKKPYGRRFNKDTEKWSINEEEQLKILNIAERYIGGESMEKLSIEHGMKYSTVHKIFQRQCGSEWTQNFNSDKLNIHATVKTKIPELLPKEMIEAVHKKAQANKTYTHGQSKNAYLLSRIIFCESCGYALTGTSTVTGGKTYMYYKHLNTSKLVNCKCEHTKKAVPSTELEETVMHHLFDCFGNASAVRTAIENAIPDRTRIKESKNRMSRISQEIQELEKQIQKATRLYMKETITEEQADKEILPVKERIKILKNMEEQLSGEMTDLPSDKAIKNTAKLVHDRRWLNHNYDEMTYENKRRLCEMVFSGKMANGRRMGIYVKWDSDGQMRFSIHGHFVEEEGLLSFNEKMQQMFFTECGGQRQRELLSGTISTKSLRIP